MEIVIRISRDSLWENCDTSSIDVESSEQAFVEQLTTAIRQHYPRASVKVELTDDFCSYHLSGQFDGSRAVLFLQHITTTVWQTFDWMKGA